MVTFKIKEEFFNFFQKKLIKLLYNLSRTSLAR
jgi:hypothetical protein